MAWLSDEIIENAPRSCRMSSGGDGFAADAAFGEGHVLGNARVEVVADHQHVQGVRRWCSVYGRVIGRRLGSTLATARP